MSLRRYGGMLLVLALASGCSDKPATPPAATTGTSGEVPYQRKNHKNFIDKPAAGPTQPYPRTGTGNK